MKPHGETAHATDAPVVAHALGVELGCGLPEDEAAKRLMAWGPNVLPAAAGRGLRHMLRDQIINVVALLLVAAALLSWASGDALQAAAIGVVLRSEERRV